MRLGGAGAGFRRRFFLALRTAAPITASMTARPCLFAFAFSLALVAPGRCAEPDWKPLLNGTSLEGWVQRGGQAKYRAEGGEIVGETVPKTPNSFLCTSRPYTNFVLELEFKPMTGLNSGIQVRSECFDREKTVEIEGKAFRIPAGRVHGYQIEIDPSERAWTGGIYDEGRRGWLKDLKENEAARKAFKANTWNQLRIECRGSSISTSLNGVPAAEIKDGVTPAGFIALQVHGVGDNEKAMQVRWRNLRIQELP